MQCRHLHERQQAMHYLKGVLAMLVSALAGLMKLSFKSKDHSQVSLEFI